MSRPGVPTCPSSARANGLLRPAPSKATLSGWVAKAVKKPESLPTRASPRRRERDARPGERIAAARVEKHQMDSARLLQVVEHPVERDRPLVDVGGVVQPRVDRDQVVAAVKLKPMAGIIKQRHVRAGRFGRERGDRPPHPGLIEVDPQRDLEAERLQRVGDIPGVVGRIDQLGNGLVAAVADDQREAAFRHRRQGRKQQRRQDRERTDGAERPPAAPAARTGETIHTRASRVHPRRPKEMNPPRMRPRVRRVKDRSGPTPASARALPS